MFRVPYNTRFAPSPTGDLHIGNLRTCYFNWLAARSTGGRFTLRIDDTDAVRNDQNKLAAINGILTTLGLDYDIRFCQSDRKYRYTQIAKALLNYRLADRASNGAIILDADRMQELFHGDEAFSWKDWCVSTMQKPTQALWDQINGTKGSLILLRGDKEDGSPGDATFHFASVVDDWDYGINLIIRGTDHFTNTHKHVILWIALNALARRAEPNNALALKHASVPEFSHVGLIMQDKKKMSKRDSTASVLKHLNDGVHPEALLNFMLRMGWGPKVDNKENSIIPKEKALSMFLTDGSMRSANSSFDANKLAWFNKKYQAMSATVSDEHSSAA